MFTYFSYLTIAEEMAQPLLDFFTFSFSFIINFIEIFSLSV